MTQKAIPGHDTDGVVGNDAMVLTAILKVSSL